MLDSRAQVHARAPAHLYRICDTTRVTAKISRLRKEREREVVSARYRTISRTGADSRACDTRESDFRARTF